MTLTEIQNEIIEEFEALEDWIDKYNYLIELSKDLDDIDSSFKTDEFVIKGCQSKVWLKAELNDGKIIFTANSDAIIVKGIIALLIRVMSDRTPENSARNLRSF